MDAKNVLKRFWNHDTFKPLQEDIISAVMDDKDSIALLPTGGGKSLCFQIPALLKDGICIVISPLIALMKDQVSALNKKGIKAMALTSDYDAKDIDVMLDNCKFGHYKFLYLSPERLQQDIVKERIKQMLVSLIAIDEAHCISQWGNDFRPTYKQLNTIKDLCPNTSIIALTATATPKVITDIANELNLKRPSIFKASFFRKELAFFVYDTQDKHYILNQIYNKHKASSILYVRYRNMALELSQYLESQGYSSTYYHAGLSNKEKEQHYNLWMSNAKQIIVATSAFGMGIDKADVKTVVHYNLPESIESYYQEAGRAGRNGRKAFSIILKNENDTDTILNKHLKMLPTVKLVKKVYKKLCNYFQIAYGEGEFCTYDFNLINFCSTYHFNIPVTYNAIKILDKTSVINISKTFNQKSEFKFIVNPKTLNSYLKSHNQYSLIANYIIRNYSGVFEQKKAIHNSQIANQLHLKEQHIEDILTALKNDNVIDLKLQKTDTQITFIKPREDDRTINIIAPFIKQVNKQKQDQVNAFMRFINNNNKCRSIQLLEYFGEKKTTACNHCDVCLKNKKNTKKKSVVAYRNQIKDLLTESPLSSRELLKKMNISSTTLINILKTMQEDNVITITTSNQYQIKLL